MKKKYILFGLLVLFISTYSCQDTYDLTEVTPYLTKTQIENQITSKHIVDVAIIDDDALDRLALAAERRASLQKGVKKAVVDDDGAQCPKAKFTSIQDAVDSGAKVIEVCEGTYAENISIVSDVKIQGAGKGVTIITGVAGTAGPIIDVTGPTGIKVDISDLTVDGQSVMVGGVVFGIRYNDADGKIKNVEVANIRNPSGSSQGLGIRVQSSTGTSSKVRVEQCMISNYTRVGINGNGTGVDLTVHKTQISGPVPPTVWAPNGVQMSRGAAGTVSHNVVDNNPSPNVPGGAGSGIILFCPGPTTVHKNVVLRADLGISVVDADNCVVSENEIYDCDFDGVSMQFLGLYFGNIGCTAPGAPRLVENNVIRNNYIKNCGDTGISLANFDLATDPSTPNNNTVKNNVIEDSGFDGIHVFDGTSNTFSCNRISTSGSTDIVDDTTGGGTAGTANTWDKNQCSSSVPAGLCSTSGCGPTSS